MSSAYKLPKTGKLSSTFHPYFPKDLNLGYSAVQDEAQDGSESLYRQTTPGKLLVDALSRYVVGKGLTPMSAPETDILGWDEKRAEQFRKESEAYWRVVTGDVNFDYYGKNTFKQLQQIAFKDILVSGDTLRHNGFRVLKNGDVVPFVQVISGRMVSQTYAEDTKTSTGGVLINKDTGREVGYLLRVIGDNRIDTTEVKPVRRYNRLGRLEFDLISLQQNDPNLVRGIPILTALRDDILDFNKFKSNHLLQSAVQSLFTAFIEKTEDAKPSTIPFAEKLAAGGASDTIENGERKLDLGPGYIVELENGEHVNLVQRQAQGDDFDSYTKSVIGLMASSLGMSYEVAMNSYNASFSASRASIGGAEKNFAILREEFAHKFCDPVWRMVIEHGILTGAIKCDEWESFSTIQRNGLFATTWAGVTPVQVDPTKEVNAYILAIGAGLCTREYAIRQLFGMDFEEVNERLIEEARLMPQPEQTAPEYDEETDDDTDDDTEDETKDEE